MQMNVCFSAFVCLCVCVCALMCVRVCVQHVTNLIQDSQAGQELQRLAACRVACATTYYAVTLAARGGEEKAAALLAALKLDVLKAYDPS